MFVSENRGFLHELAKTYGVFGLFFGAIIANATIFLPVPFDAVLFFIGTSPEIVGIGTFSVFTGLLICIIAAIGAGIGEMTAYLAGLAGISAAEKAKHEEFHQIGQIRKKLESYGMLFVFFAALVPFPFDIIGITAGIIKYDVRRFFLAIVFGKIVRYSVVLFSARFGVELVGQFFLH